MQEKIWYYEKWLVRHAAFPPSRCVKMCWIFLLSKVIEVYHNLFAVMLQIGQNFADLSEILRIPTRIASELSTEINL